MTEEEEALRGQHFVAAALKYLLLFTGVLASVLEAQHESCRTAIGMLICALGCAFCEVFWK